MMEKYTLSGFKITQYDELQSTNTAAMQIPRAEVQDKSVILTYRQTQGRGQVGNKWESESEKNISMTIIFSPLHFDAAQQFAVSMVIALGCCDFIGRYVQDCTIKWPNDIYVGDQKIAGILIEHTIVGAYIGFSICGIGVNINQHEFRSDAPNPVSLYQLIGKELPLPEVLAGLLECIGKRYNQLFEYEKLTTDYLALMYRRKGMYEWQDERGRFKASIAGIDEYGRLILRDENGQCKEYGFKEVVWL